MKPIIFNTEMVQAILEGRKTQTRRVIRWKPYREGNTVNFNSPAMSLGHYCTGAPESGHVLYSRRKGGTWSQRTKPIHPRYQPGDIIWVRETWQHNPCRGSGWPYDYRATPELNSYEHDTWRPSIHMPREAARLLLRVKDVWVERLQNITEGEAAKEGCCTNWDEYPKTNTQKFQDLWDLINAKRGHGWDTNPWVWGIEFERTERP